MVVQSNSLTEIEIRQAFLEDAGLIWFLLSEHQEKFLSDEEELDPHYIKDLIDSGDLYLIQYRQMVFGIFSLSSLSETRPNGCRLAGTLHLLIEPKFWRFSIKQHVVATILDFVFLHYRLLKIKAAVYQTQSTALSLLKKHGFILSGILQNEVLVNSKKTDLLLFELSLNGWLKHKKLTFKTN